MSSGDNIKVAIKVRPLIQREREQKLGVQWRIQGDTIECVNPIYQNVKFSFDQICDENTTTQDLFDKVTKPIVESSVNGFNGTIFAYGQTSSGKTHTMLGTADQPGITILAVRDIFDNMNRNSDRSYLLRVSYIEIYNERVYDLLDKRNELKIKETGNGDHSVNSVEKIVNSEQMIMDLLAQGNKERKVAETKMNVQSSRSHTIFSIIIESQDRSGVDESDAAVQISVLNLVDLAGSERADATGTTGSRLKEGAHINKSLLSLSLVINKLSEDPEQSKHINYRDSKLTRILQPSLGGNALTAIICTITPAVVEETNYTLGFANRAKKIKNKPTVNEVLSDAVMLKRMHKQIAGLEKQLNDERAKCKKIETNLFQRKDQIIGGRGKLALNRRRTWAPTVTQNENGDARPQTPSAEQVPLSSSVFGHQIEYTEEQFNSILDSTFSSVCPIPSMNNTPFGRNLASRVGKSLLKTPKSFLRRPSLLVSSTAAASPVNTYDKDKRIESLEIELEELQQFQKLESDDFADILAKKASLIDSLTQQTQELDLLKQLSESSEVEIKSLQAQLNNMKISLKTEVAKSEKLEGKLKESTEYRLATEQRMKKLEAEMSEAAKAKTLAECNFSSIQFEYEQYKNKSKARERELVEQIDEKTFEKQIKMLNEKITELLGSREQLEVTVWESESKLKSSIAQSNGKDKEIERLSKDNLMLRTQVVDGQKYVSAGKKLDTLQKEYDDLSTQLMDRIQEHDDSVKKHAAIVSDLSQSIDTLKLSLAEEKTRAEMLSNELSTLRKELHYNNEQLEAANDNLASEREQFNREIESLRSSLQQSVEQLKDYQLEAAAEKTSINDRLNSAVADANVNLARNEQLQKEIESLKLSLDELKIKSENKQTASKVMDGEMNKGIDTVCVLLKNSVDECDRLRAELNAVYDRLDQLNGEYAESIGREKELSTVHTNAVNEHAIVVASHEATLIQVNEDHTVTISSLEREIAELNKQLIVQYRQQQSTHTQTELCRCEELEREKGILEEICNKSRITIQFSVNELAILRHSYAELKMTVAKQELANLKLQKTINENDDDFIEANSVFASTMASTTTIANDTLMADCSVVQRDDDKQASATAVLDAKIRELSETCVTHENDWKRLYECLLDASTADDIEKLLTKVKELKEKAAEYDRLLQIMITANASFSQYENIENAIIESQQKHLETSEQLLVISNNYETLKEKFNVIQNEFESVRNENDSMKCSLSDSKEKMTSIEEEINRQLAVNEKLRKQIIVEQENESKSREKIEIWAKQTNELETVRNDLVEENKSLSDRMIEKATEIERLQRIVEENFSVEQDLAKMEELRREINEIKNQLSLKECEVVALNAEKMAIAAQLDDKNSQIDKFELDRPKLAVAHKTVETLTNELNELKEQKTFFEEKQAHQQTEVDKLVSEKEELTAQLSEMDRKMIELKRSKEDEVNEMLRMIECLTHKNHNLEANNEKLKSDLVDSIANSKNDEEKLRQMTVDQSNQLQREKENDEKFHKTIDQLKTKISVFEDEQDVLERENKSLTSTIDTQQKQIGDLQSKLNGINDELTAIKRELATKVAECKVLETGCSEAEQLRDTIEKMKIKVQSANDKKAEIEYKNNQFTATINKQSADIDQMKKVFAEKEKKSKMVADKELQSVRQELNRKCAEHLALTEKVANMEKLYNETVANQPKASTPHGHRLSGDSKTTNKSHSSSGVDVDNLLRENHNLKTSQQRLIDELDDLRTTTRQARKSKRHSTHDDTRRISGFNSNLFDVHVQTEPVNELCRCIEFGSKIDQLKRDIVIKDAKFNTLKLHTGIDSVKRENEELQKTLSTIRADFNTHRIEHQRVVEKYDKARRKLVEFLNAEANSPVFTHSSTQTDANEGAETTAAGSYVSQMNVYKLNDKYQTCKKSYLQMKEAYEALQVDHEKAKGMIEMLKQKYEQVKSLCLHRQTEINRLEEIESDLRRKFGQTKKDLEMVQVKYTNAKLVLQHRANEIDKLHKMHSIIDENTPTNGNCSKALSDADGKR